MEHIERILKIDYSHNMFMVLSDHMVSLKPLNLSIGKNMIRAIVTSVDGGVDETGEFIMIKFYEV